MQNRYVGDVGDFGKYGLLRALAGIEPAAEPRLSLGIVWYLVSTEEANNDGKHDGYLNLCKEGVNKKYFDCDPGLYAALKEIRHKRCLAVSGIAEREIFRRDTVFFDEPLSFEGMPHIGAPATQRRKKHRGSWLERSLQATAACDIVFVDPDNGLEIPGTAAHHGVGPKHVYYDELKGFLAREQSLVIYHHLGRSGGTHLEQIADRAEQIKAKLSLSYDPLILHYHRGTARPFFVVPSKARDHKILLNEKAQKLVHGPWGKYGHFT